jgi:hypothetical protein
VRLDVCVSRRNWSRRMRGPHYILRIRYEARHRGASFVAPLPIQVLFLFWSPFRPNGTNSSHQLSGVTA